MGKALGVLHATGPNNEPVGPEQVAQLTTVAGQAGARIGTVRAFRQTELQASTDGLTGLMNRRTFENRARELLVDRRTFSVALADLDHFKRLNDTHGHDAGDRALRHFSETLRGAVRGDDLVCRFGGEEFAMIFPDASVEAATELLDRVQVMLAAANTGEVPAVTATFGVTDSTAADSLDELIRIADRALYAGKEAGRNRVTVAATEHRAAVGLTN
jgi:diguanylate cyclase (GGDEF)-like protein